MHKSAAAVLFGTLLGVAVPVSADVIVNQGIAESEVLAAQQGWCKALVDISTTHQMSGQDEAKKTCRAGD
jgi:hypothetical protein